MKRKRSALSIKDKQIIISCLDKGGKKENFSSWIFQPWYIQDKDKILKFTDNSRKSLKLADVPFDQAVHT